MDIFWAVLWFAVLGGLFGGLLALADRFFKVEKDEREDKIRENLPGANCGGCGFAGCDALAAAIVKGEAKCSACPVCSDEQIGEICKIMEISPEPAVKLRAQVMCSGVCDTARIKYVYEGEDDCSAAMRLGGGPKECPQGCIGLGTCVKACPFGAISVQNGVAFVDYSICTGCGVCVASCPKKIIKLIPCSAGTWVVCSSRDKGVKVRSYCDAGCIGCGICARKCKTGAITVNDNVASIDYEKCTGCGECAAACPRKIIITAGKCVIGG